MLCSVRSPASLVLELAPAVLVALLAIGSAGFGSDAARKAMTPISAAAAATNPPAAPAPQPQEEARPVGAPAERREGQALKLVLKHGMEHWGRPNAWVYVPSAFDPRKKELHVVVLFRGFKNCIDSYVSPHGIPCVMGRPARTGYDVAKQVERSGTGAIVVLPELAFDQPNADPGALGLPGGLHAFLKELVEEALTPQIGPHRYEDIDRVALFASSGGYQALVPALAFGDVAAIRDIYLMDAFYVDNAAMTGFLRDHLRDFSPSAPADKRRRFGLIYCHKFTGTQRQSFRFGAEIERWFNEAGMGDQVVFEPFLKPVGPALDDLRPPVTVYRTRLEHDQIVANYLWQILLTSGI
jgi:hypothetical protein